MSKCILKELWELTEKDRKEIYEYAIKRSEEIVSSILGGKYKSADVDDKPETDV